jgi:tyrosyl-tRNA synthetase
LLLLDGPADVQRKMKKAFCEPANLTHCPPLTVAIEAVLPYGAARALRISRPAENGGDLDYTDAATLRSAFVSGELHPGDLKPAARDAVNEVLQRVRAAISADDALKKAEKEVEKAAKRKKK